jgi:eukaryotic-like serine/threonine-protein kinase
MTGEVVSHYRILERLGSGGMGVVYKAEDTKLKRTVALKFLPPDLTSDEPATGRFIHEAQTASSLDHPNICTIHEIDRTENGRLFIVMACYEGETLKKRIQRGPMKIQDAIEIALQVAHGLAKAHEHGIVHRDIYPSNIMITGDGIVKIIDFGLAKLAGRTRLTREGTTVGTVAYLSPEQARGDAVDHRTDIWSLGVVMYEMLTGEPPFKSDYEQAVIYSILNEEPKAPSTLRPCVPAGLDRIVMKALAKDPAQRHQRVSDFINEISRGRQTTLHDGFD